uniref:HTH iclR-type domain-containing protein n=1 Tax=Strongyloides venezuelensis TaxID=75913 RepID=A0A0K0FH40_STRVS
MIYEFKGDNNAAEITQEINENSKKILSCFNAVKVNPCATIRELEKGLNVSKTSMSNYLKKIVKTKKLDKSGQCFDRDEAPKQPLIPKLSPKKKRSAVIHRKRPILLYDNVKPNVSKIIVQKRKDLGCKTPNHQAYSPGLASTDSHFFKRFGNSLMEKPFKNNEDINTVFEDFIKSRTSDFYQME